MRHEPSSQGACSPAVVIGESALNAVVKPARSQIVLQLQVDRLRIALIQPRKQLLELLGRKRVNCAFDFLDRI